MNASVKRARVVSSIRLMASDVCAIDSTRSVRCVVRNTWRFSRSSNCSMAIMFTGPSRSIFALQRDDRLFGAHRCRRRALRPERQRPPRAAHSRQSPAVASSSSDSGSGSSAVMAAASGVASPACSIASTSASTSSSETCTASRHSLRQMREVALRRGAGDVELRGFGANPFEHLTGVLDAHVLRVDADAQSGSRFIGAAQLLAQAIDRPHVLVERRARRPRSPSSSDSRRARVCSSSARRSDTRCSSSRAASSRRATSLTTADARSTSAACAARASAARARRAAPRPHGPRQDAAAPAAAAPRRARCASSVRPIDASASGRRASSCARSSSAARRSSAITDALRVQPRDVVFSVRQLRFVADDGRSRGDAARR